MIPKIVKKATPATIENVVLGAPEKKVTKLREPSLRQQKAIKEFMENGGNKGKALKKAGYATASAKNPDKVFNNPSVKHHLINPVVEKMKAERDAILALMPKKRKNANYAVLGTILPKLNHDIALLEGNPTERIETPLSQEEMDKLDALIAKNS